MSQADLKAAGQCETLDPGVVRPAVRQGIGHPLGSVASRAGSRPRAMIPAMPHIGREEVLGFRRRGREIRISNFEFRICFGFRISNFEFGTTVQ